MAIDIKYYFKQCLNNDSYELFSKYFGKKNFKSLYSAHRYFSILSDEDLAWVNDREKKSTLDESSSLSNALLEQQYPLYKLLEEEIYPRVDPIELLSELSPKQSMHNIILECPACGKKEAYIGNHGKGTNIICNRENKCGEKISFVKYIQQSKTNGSYYAAVKYIADSVGIDIQALTQSKEMQKNGDSVKSYEKEKSHINNKPIQRDWIEEINFKELDAEKTFTLFNTAQYVDKVTNLNLNKKQKYQIVLSYIRDFSQSNKNEKKILDYFSTRGLPIPNLIQDVGFISREQIPKLVNNLKDIFGEKELIDLSILSEKGHWKHGAVDKDTKKFQYCDALLFNMHDPYSDIPTNLEFRFIGNRATNLRNKTSAIENSDIVQPNYYGMNYNAEYIQSKDIWWFQEGSIDAKTITALGYNSCSLIGVHKHFDEIIGYFKDKTAVICFDQDNAGYKNTQKFAEKLYMAGAKNIIVATWDNRFGNDVNDLLINKNLEKIKFSKLQRTTDEEKYNKPVYTYSINTSDINKKTLHMALNKIYNLQDNYKVSQLKNEGKKIQIDDKKSTGLGLEAFLVNR